MLVSDSQEDNREAGLAHVAGAEPGKSCRSGEEPRAKFRRSAPRPRKTRPKGEKARCCGMESVLANV